MESQNRKAVIIGLSAIAIILVAAGIIFFATNKNSVDVNKREYYDKNSGETISNPEGKAPEPSNFDKTMPVFLGFKEFINLGLTKYQQMGIMKAFHQYSKEHDNYIKEVSLHVKSPKITLSQESNVNNKIDYTVTINRKNTHTVMVEYFDISKIKLYLYDKNKTLIYTSEVIDTTEDVSDNQYHD